MAELMVTNSWTCPHCQRVYEVTTIGEGKRFSDTSFTIKAREFFFKRRDGATVTATSECMRIAMRLLMPKDRLDEST